MERLIQVNKAWNALSLMAATKTPLMEFESAVLALCLVAAESGRRSAVVFRGSVSAARR